MIYITKETIEYEEIPPMTIHPINLCQVSNNTKLNLWHRRLGHFSIKRLKNKLLKINIPIFYHICAGSKLRNKPHSPNFNRARKPLELIYMDLVGPIDESIQGNKYFLTILDDYSRFGWIYFMKNKSHTFEKFKMWYSHVNNIYNHNIKYIRTDNVSNWGFGLKITRSTQRA